MIVGRETAFQQRWLIVMERQAEDDDIGLSYCLWLRALDGTEQTATRFHTLDELFDALFGYWEESSVISSYDPRRQCETYSAACDRIRR